MIELPRPVIDADTEQFWAAAREHRLLVQFCTKCNHAIHYPRALCPRCWNRDLEWRESCGRGEIYSYTVSRRAPVPAFADQIPLVVALIDLDEGARMMSNIVTDDPSKIRIGQRVRVVFHDIDEDFTLPKFELDE